MGWNFLEEKSCNPLLWENPMVLKWCCHLLKNVPQSQWLDKYWQVVFHRLWEKNQL